MAPAILNESGEELEGEAEGYLVFKQPWPGIMRTVYGNHTRFETTYFKKFPGYYVTGDGEPWLSCPYPLPSLSTFRVEQG